MAVQPQYLAYILEQLEPLANTSSRRMFSAVGLYSGELFFGLIHDDTLFLKTDGSNSAEYIARRMPQFAPFPERPEAVMAYHQVPANVIEDGESLIAWARKSVAVALAARAAKAGPKGRVAGRHKMAKKKKKALRRPKRRAGR